MPVEIKLKKQPQKYLASVDEATRKNFTVPWISCLGWKVISFHWQERNISTAIRSHIIA